MRSRPETAIVLVDRSFPFRDWEMTFRDTHFPLRDPLFPFRDPLFPFRDTHFPLRDTLFPFPDTHFPLRDTLFPVRETHFPVRDALFPFDGTHFPVRETHFPVRDPHFPFHDRHLPHDDGRFPLLHARMAMGENHVPGDRVDPSFTEENDRRMPPRSITSTLVIAASVMFTTRVAPASGVSAPSSIPSDPSAQLHRGHVECMPLAEAQRARDATGVDEDDPLNPIQVTRRGTALGCPVEIVQHVGRGHSNQDHWNVAPLNRPSTRRSQARTPHTCCYDAADPPGSPRG